MSILITMDFLMRNKSLLVCWRGLTEVWHQKKLIAFLVSYPLIFMLVFGSAFGGDTSPISVDMTVVEPIGGVDDPMVEAFIAQFESTEGLNVTRIVASGQDPMLEASSLVNDGETLVMFAPTSFFQEDVLSVPVQIFYDSAADQNEQSIALGISSGIIEGFSSAVFEQKIVGAQQSGYISSDVAVFIKSNITPIVPDIKGISPTDDADFNYIDFLIPGLVAMSMLWTGVTGASSSIVEDKVLGIRRRILSTPTSRISILIGTMLTHFVMLVIQICILLLVAVLIYDLNIVGSWWLVALIVFIGSFSMIGLGVLIGTITKTAEEASQFSLLINFPMMFLSGIFFPLSQGWMKVVSKIFPLTYVNEALRDVMIRGYSISEVSASVGIAVAFTVAIIVVGLVMLERGESS